MNEALQQSLYDKLSREQDKYRDWLKGQPPEEILHHSYEYTVREDKEETPPSTPEPEEEGLQSDTSAYGELIGRRVFHKSKKAYARVVGCDGEYMVLNFESGDKAGQDVKYNLTMCLNNGWIEVVD